MFERIIKQPLFFFPQRTLSLSLSLSLSARLTVQPLCGHESSPRMRENHENGRLVHRAKVSMINLPSKIMVRVDLVSRGCCHSTVCRILSLYNLTPLPAKLRETDGEGNNGARNTKFEVFNSTYLS